jgi:alkylation response protein AidB-like acyl-CoA dehydrogenase
MEPSPILTPVDEQLDVLCEALAAATATGTAWPARQLAWCGDRGVFRWSASREVGGLGWTDADLLRGYLRLGEACLATAFVITQRTAASTRLADSANGPLRERLLPELLAGRSFATVAISQLTTSRRHLAAPALRARETASGYSLSGYSPWVTGAIFADWLAVGAVLDDGRQLLVAVPAGTAGMAIDPPHALVALEASHTGPVRFDDVAVARDWVIAGPSDQVLRTARSGGSGGLQTSALALALAARAIRYLEAEADHRRELTEVACALRNEWQAARSRLLAEAVEPVEAAGMTGAESLRARANELALRAAQSALVAAKGSGFIEGHPAGRWCREALFFFVWSCPPGVAAAHLREWSEGSFCSESNSD